MGRFNSPARRPGKNPRSRARAVVSTVRGDGLGHFLTGFPRLTARAISAGGSRRWHKIRIKLWCFLDLPRCCERSFRDASPNSRYNLGPPLFRCQPPNGRGFVRISPLWREKQISTDVITIYELYHVPGLPLWGSTGSRGCPIGMGAKGANDTAVQKDAPCKERKRCKMCGFPSFAGPEMLFEQAD